MVCIYGTSREETEHRQPASKVEVTLGMLEISLHVICIVVSLELRVSHCCYVYYTACIKTFRAYEFPLWACFGFKTIKQYTCIHDHNKVNGSLYMWIIIELARGSQQRQPPMIFWISAGISRFQSKDLTIVRFNCTFHNIYIGAALCVAQYKTAVCIHDKNQYIFKLFKFQYFTNNLWDCSLVADASKLCKNLCHRQPALN